MANTQPCGECGLYHAIVKPHRSGKKSRDTGKGHCLARTVYANNKPGKHVYPVRAKTAELPYGRHKIALCRAAEVKAHCTSFTPKKG